MNERARSSETISACPGRATFAAARAANRRSAAPARGSQTVPTAASARLSAGSRPPYSRSTPFESK